MPSLSEVSDFQFRRPPCANVLKYMVLCKLMHDSVCSACVHYDHAVVGLWEFHPRRIHMIRKFESAVSIDWYNSPLCHWPNCSWHVNWSCFPPPIHQMTPTWCPRLYETQLLRHATTVAACKRPLLQVHMILIANANNYGAPLLSARNLRMPKPVFNPDHHVANLSGSPEVPAASGTSVTGRSGSSGGAAPASRWLSTAPSKRSSINPATRRRQQI